MKLATQILAFYFLLGSLLPGTDFSQLKKAPAIWKHYQLHRQLAAEAGHEASFSGFLSSHFLTPGSHQHNDGGQSHEDLPLKSVHVLSPVLPSGSIPFPLRPLPVFYNPAAAHGGPFSGALYAHAVFRPPIVS